MATNYNLLLSFMKSHRSDPVALAKIITAWQWTSLLPGGHGVKPTGAESVPAVLNASCGWRDILMKDLFEEIGIVGRRVNFYDVPFQGNHTATELFINGKWMFFDATFGIYFTSKKGGQPLSIAEVRSQWPDVVIQKANLAGWQGKFIDPKTINASRAFSASGDPFFFQPEQTYGKNVVGGELYSLYLAVNAAYRVEGQETKIDAPGRTWKVRADVRKAASWSKIIDTYDAAKKLDARHGYNDDGSKWFIDWDQTNKYEWSQKTVYVTKNSRIEKDITKYDDKSSFIYQNDADRKFSWSELKTYYASSKAADWQEGLNDDGTRWLIDWDVANASSWQYFRDTYDSAGRVVSTYFLYDDGTGLITDWSHAAVQSGSAANDVLLGDGGVDFLQGFAGNDILNGAAGADRLEGGRGSDSYVVDHRDDLVVENDDEGVDTVFASINYSLGRNVENLVLSGNAVYGTGNAESNSIAGNEVGNILSGLSGNDRVYGFGGNDRLVGGSGNDTLEGGTGADTLYGNAGADVFLWRKVDETGETTSSADLVKDFSFRSGDRLNLSSIDANQIKAGNQAFTFIGTAPFSAPGQVRYFQGGGETKILLNTDADHAAEAMIRLSGTVKPDAAWFVL